MAPEPVRQEPKTLTVAGRTYRQSPTQLLQDAQNRLGPKLCLMESYSLQQRNALLSDLGLCFLATNCFSGRHVEVVTRGQFPSTCTCIFDSRNLFNKVFRSFELHHITSKTASWKPCARICLHAQTESVASKSRPACLRYVTDSRLMEPPSTRTRVARPARAGRSNKRVRPWRGRATSTGHSA